MNYDAFDYEAFGNVKIIENRESICLSIGNFDGVHLGHVDLIKQMHNRYPKIPKVILTFYPHPHEVLGDDEWEYLTCISDRVDLLLSLGVELVIVQKFSVLFSQLSPFEFCHNYLFKIFNISSIVLGYDFRFGKNNIGNYELLCEYGRSHGCEVDTTSALMHDDLPISSTRIKSELLNGNLLKVKLLLGRNYKLFGKVVLGYQRGRTLGFPTANVSTSCGAFMPRVGVYCGYIHIFDDVITLPVVMNLGTRPTFGNADSICIEAHIIDFSGDLYNKQVSLEFIAFLRDEVKFDSEESLINQIVIDIGDAKRVLEI